MLTKQLRNEAEKGRFYLVKCIKLIITATKKATQEAHTRTIVLPLLSITVSEIVAFAEPSMFSPIHL